MPTITELSLVRNPESTLPSAPESLRAEYIRSTTQVLELVDEWAQRDEPVSFREFEQALRLVVAVLARAAITLFLSIRESKLSKGWPSRIVRGERTFRKAPAQGRNLTTWFGVVRYSRTYFREVTAADRRHGLYPLDESLGLSTDRFSWNVLSFAVLLSLKLSFSEARKILVECVPQAPSTEVIEQTVLGLGRHTTAWFEQAPMPTDDGDVLVIMIDGKGAPTATDSELKRRRGKRLKRKMPASPRHRGRARKGRYPNSPRRKKGDKSKHAKMATMVVMYTLKRNGLYLLGPINRRYYASFAPKRHAFEYARREAEKRGFGPNSCKLVQFVTDGDTDLELYAKEYLPHARHTLDVIHAIEKVWLAGACLYPEGSRELKDWVEVQKDRLYGGKPEDVVAEMQARLDAIPKTGPGNKGKRSRLSAALGYLEKRLALMPYKELIEADMEIGSGQVEGAVKNIIGKRCDHGGMRWIKERVEAVVQLRCIEANGHWDNFMAFVAHRVRQEAMATGARVRLQSATAAPLPTIQEAA